MVAELLLKEEVMPLAKLPAAVRKLSGVTRIVDAHGKTFGLFLDAAAMEDLLEELESASPEFSVRLAASRTSGKISGSAVKRAVGLNR